MLVKAIEDAALGMASVYRGVGSATAMTNANRAAITRCKKFARAARAFMPFDLVIDEQTATGDEARVSKTSVCGSWGAIAGELRYFADQFGQSARRNRGHAGSDAPHSQLCDAWRSEIAYDPKQKGGQLVIRRTLEYFGFELEREVEAIERFPRRAMPTRADALWPKRWRRGRRDIASVKKNRAAIDAIQRDVSKIRRNDSALRLADLTAWYEEQLVDVMSMDDFRNARFTLESR